MANDIIGDIAKQALDEGVSAEVVNKLVGMLDAFEVKLRELIANEIEHFPLVWTGTENPTEKELQRAADYKDEYVKMFAHMVRNSSDYWA